MFQVVHRPPGGPPRRKVPRFHQVQTTGLIQGGDRLAILLPDDQHPSETAPSPVALRVCRGDRRERSLRRIGRSLPFQRLRLAQFSQQDRRFERGFRRPARRGRLDRRNHLARRRLGRFTDEDPNAPERRERKQRENHKNGDPLASLCFGSKPVLYRHHEILTGRAPKI